MSEHTDDDYWRLVRENQFLREQNARLLAVIQDALKDVEEIGAILGGKVAWNLRINKDQASDKTNQEAWPVEAARQFTRGEISAGKFGELLGLQPGELHDFKTAVHAFDENPENHVK